MDKVAPFTGVWIEIASQHARFPVVVVVAPFTGVWIEIRLGSERQRNIQVAPFTGVWIEMFLKWIDEKT